MEFLFMLFIIIVAIGALSGGLTGYTEETK
jgi:hypothetical protein